jgi:phosphopantothenoylcysteine decarboxylase/phosphopantothenate--cysteine ligase
MSILAGKRVVLGVSGGIAAYKALDLASQLVQAGATVDVVMTNAALEFITPLSFEALTKRPVRSGIFEAWTEAGAGHVTLALEADALVVAPATANTLAKLAHGLADDMLSVTALSAAPRGVPLVLAPAMEHHMYAHPATQANLATLRARGAWVVGPEHGRLASGQVGNGRLVAPRRILETLELALGAGGVLAGKHLLVTAGATREAIDPIRMLTNRSTGKMGYAIARAAAHAGARVTLLATPGALSPVEGVALVPVESALELLDAVRAHVVGVDALIMAAAVADYRPARVAEHKIKKADDDLSLTLTRNPDILSSVETPGVVRVGFAAETQHLEANARGKLARKRLDLIVANDARLAMGGDDNAVTLYFADGRVEQLPMASKDAIAEALIERVAALVAARQTHIGD